MLRIFVGLGFALFFLWAVAALIPNIPQVPTIEIDGSWAYGLNLAHAEKLVFGKDIIFTFGPLGYLFYPAPELVGPIGGAFVGWTNYVLLLLGMTILWYRLRSSWLTGICWATLAGGMLLSDLPFESMQLSYLALVLGLLVMLVERSAIPSLYLLMVGALAGVIPLFKTNEGFAAIVVFYGLLIGMRLSGRGQTPAGRQTVLWAALSPLVVLLLGYVLVEGGLSGFWGYLFYSAQVALGYSEGMALPGPAGVATIAKVTLVLICAIPLLLSSRRELLIGFLPAVAAAFLAFKAGMVRQDPMHGSILPIRFAVSALFLLLCVKTRRDRVIVASFVLASLGYGLIHFARTFPLLWGVAIHRATMQRESVRGTLWPGYQENLVNNWNFSASWKQMAIYHERNMKQLTVDPSVAAIVRGGTADDIPFNLPIVGANGWRWAPRPVFQSYSAYTPELDLLNARHLAGPASAGHIFLHWGDIDGKQPLLDDAASWRSLFDHYDIVLKQPDMFVLERRASSRFLEPRAVGSVNSVWHRDIRVPHFGPAEFTMMRVDVPRGFWGVIRGFLFRNSPVFVDVTHASGAHGTWRVTRANLADGAFVGILPRDVQETQPYFGQIGFAPADPIVSLRFESRGLLEYATNIHIDWFAVGLKPAEVQRLERPHLNLSQVWKPGQAVAADGAEIQTAPAEVIVRPSQFDPRVMFHCARDLGSYRTLMIKARLSRPGRVDAFFGRQVDGRSLAGNVPDANRWLEIYLNVGANPQWASEAGADLRFDPPDESIGSTIEIAGIEASAEKLPGEAAMNLYPVEDAQLNALPIPPARLPSVGRPLDLPTRYSIDALNGSPLTGEPVAAQSNGSITVSGWAVDAPSHKPASAVFIDVDGRLFSTTYGISRKDVADALKEKSYEKSGFASRIYSTSGSHRAHLRIVSAAGSTYYETPPITLKVK